MQISSLCLTCELLCGACADCSSNCAGVMRVLPANLPVRKKRGHGCPRNSCQWLRQAVLFYDFFPKTQQGCECMPARCAERTDPREWNPVDGKSSAHAR